MVQYDISEPVRNYRICLWEKFLFYWSQMEQQPLFCHGNRQNIYGLLTISSANAILILTCFVRYVCYGTLYSP